MSLRFAVIGSPVSHSKSPVMHEAAYRAFGLPHVYEKLETSEAELTARVQALRRGDLAGLNVTVPHKTRVLSLADEIDESARVVGAANTLARRGARVVALNTDAEALALELVRVAGGAEPLRGRTGLVLGTGGAARAAVAALGFVGVRRVVVCGRSMTDWKRRDAFTRDAERILAASAPHPDAVGTTSVVVRPLGAGWAPPSDVAAIVQATSCGMIGAPSGDVVAEAIDWAAVPADAVALDVVYAPRHTPFLARAGARGLRADDGLGMLARQGALAFELWLGTPAPYDVMRRAADDDLTPPRRGSRSASS